MERNVKTRCFWQSLWTFGIAGNLFRSTNRSREQKRVAHETPRPKHAGPGAKNAKGKI